MPENYIGLCKLLLDQYYLMQFNITPRDLWLLNENDSCTKTCTAVAYMEQ